MTIASVQRGSPAPDAHHLRPLMVYVSPSRVNWQRMLVASEDATLGSATESDRVGWWVCAHVRRRVGVKSVKRRVEGVHACQKSSEASKNDNPLCQLLALRFEGLNMEGRRGRRRA